MSAIDKVFTLIDVLAAREEPYGLTELSRASGLDKATTHRLLEAMIRHGYVTKLDEPAQYELSMKLWMLGSRVVARRPLLQLAQQPLRELAEMSGETVYLSVCEGLKAVYLAKIDSRHPLRAHTPIGGRVPLYCGSTGKALLAYFDRADIETVAESLEPFTDRTISTRAALLEALAEVRAQGYATAEGEWDPSISGVAAPIFGPDCTPVASIGITGPIERLNSDLLRSYGPRVAEIAWNLSRSLGCPAESIEDVARAAPAL